MKLIKTLLLLAVAVVICGCSAVERTVYLQDVANNSSIKAVPEEQIRIKPHDRLTIVVSSKDPELAAPFNATSSYNSLSSNPMGSSTANGASSLQVRTVDENGVLYIPIIGNVYCAGKTRSDLSAEIAQKIINGGPLTLEFHASIFKDPESIRKVALLVQSFIKLGGHQLQLNSVDPAVLKAAQEHPEDYRSLIVRIWGWSAYFVELDKEYQDHVISRQSYTV